MRTHFYQWVQLGRLLAAISLSASIAAATSCSRADKGPEVPLTDAELAAATAESTPSDSQAKEEEPSKYSDLPLNLRKGITACEAEKRYYDLTLGTCTDTALSSFNCIVDELVAPQSTILTEQLKTKLTDYIAAKLQGYKLFACTETAQDYELHFYQPTTEKVFSSNVKLLKPTP